MRTFDDDLMDFKALSDIKEKVQNDKNFFDNSMNVQALINAMTTPVPLANNRRAITWNIPRLDLVWRTNPYVKRAVNWLSSKPLIKGIDINSTKAKAEELNETQHCLNNLYRPLKKMLENGFVYGGGANLIILKDRQKESDYSRPLDIDSVKKGDFLGLKPLVRWYQIEPALDKGLIEKISKEEGLYDTEEIGKPLYYRVNLSGGLNGYSGKNKGQFKGHQMLVHRSWLLLFNPHSLSYIETQIERFWSSSIIETAWVDLERHEMIWAATTKSAIKNNLGVLTIYGLDGVLNRHSRKLVNEKIELVKETSNQGVLAIGEKDKFEFAESSLVGNEKALEQSMRQVSNSFRTPPHVMFPDDMKFNEEAYMQSVSDVEDMQEGEIRPILDILIQITFKHLYGKKIQNFDFKFKPIITLTPEKKANVMKTMTEVLNRAFEDEAISLVDYQKMLPDILDNPSNIFRQIDKDYIDQVLSGDEDGNMITFSTKQIEIAKALNQLSQQNDSNEKGKKKSKQGLAGVKSPESSVARVDKGGDPTKSKKPLKRHSLNKEKGKE